MNNNEIIEYLIKKYNCRKGKEFSYYIALYYGNERFDLYTLTQYLTYRAVIEKINSTNDIDRFVARLEERRKQP